MTTDYDNRALGWRLDETPDPRNANYPIAAILPPTLEPRSFEWPCTIRLDQGPDGACVGFAFAGELAAEPVIVPDIDYSDGMRIYKAAQKIDEWPGENYEGTSVLAGAKIVQSEGFMDEYRWANSLTDIILTVGHLGPVVLGIPWYNSMFAPDVNGMINVTGQVVGGHAFILRGVDIERQIFKMQNSWGRSWGIDNGCAYLRFADVQRLVFGEQGTACVPVKRSGGVQPTPDIDWSKVTDEQIEAEFVRRFGNVSTVDIGFQLKGHRWPLAIQPPTGD